MRKRLTHADYIAMMELIEAKPTVGGAYHLWEDDGSYSYYSWWKHDRSIRWTNSRNGASSQLMAGGYGPVRLFILAHPMLNGMIWGFTVWGFWMLFFWWLR